MPFEVGNRYGGRRRDLGRELQRLEEASRHVDNLFGEAGLYMIADAEQDKRGATGPWRQPWRARADAVLTEAMAARGALADDVRRLMKLAREVQAIVPPEALKGRRKRRHTPDPGLSELASTLARLDRIIGSDGDPQ